MNPLIEKLYARVREDCPELMELSDGCKFKLNNKIYFVVYNEIYDNPPGAFNSKGEACMFRWDVERFVERYKCDPKNEPISEWD